jgi:hypothetical protein
MGHFQQEIVAGVLGTVIGGLILALLTGSGGASRFLRFVLIAGILVVAGALVLSQMRGSGWQRRGDAPDITHLMASVGHASPAHEVRRSPMTRRMAVSVGQAGWRHRYLRPLRPSHHGQTPGVIS